jgi:hypothetical protein
MMLEKRDKRGSHVEVMLSFIIFVTFVLFLLSILMPSVGTQKDKVKIFQGIEIAIINKVSSNITSITVNIGDINENCVNLDNFMLDAGIGSNIIVKDPLGTTVSSDINADSLQITRASTGDKFFRVYYSPEFESLNSGTACSLINYSIGLTKTSQYVFERKFLEMMNENHETLGNEINVPDGIGFGYGIVLANGTTIETQEMDIAANVYVKDTPVEYVDLDGNILEGYIKTKIW